MAPKKSEIRYVVPGFIILGSVLFVLEKCGISFLDYTWWQEVLSDSWRIVTYIVSILLTILGITLMVVGFIKGFKLVFGYKN